MQDRPASSRPPTFTRFAGMENTEKAVAEAIATLRSPQTPWLARRPGHYGWAVQSDQYAEVTIAALAERGCHFFLRFGEYGAPRYLIFQCSRKQMLSLDVLRVEVDPPLPTTWFDADAPEMDTRTPGGFAGGEPSVPLAPGFYAPGATPPHAYGVNLPPVTQPPPGGSGEPNAPPPPPPGTPPPMPPDPGATPPPGTPPPDPPLP